MRRGGRIRGPLTLLLMVLVLAACAGGDPPDSGIESAAVQATSSPQPTQQATSTRPPAPGPTRNTVSQVTVDQQRALDDALDQTTDGVTVDIDEAVIQAGEEPGTLSLTVPAAGLTPGVDLSGLPELTLGNLTIAPPDGRGERRAAIALDDTLTVRGEAVLVPRDAELEVVFRDLTLELRTQELLTGGSEEGTEVAVTLETKLTALPGEDVALDVKFAKDAAELVPDSGAVLSQAAARVRENGVIEDLETDVAFSVQVTRINLDNADLGDTTARLEVSSAWVESRQAEGKEITVVKLDDQGALFLPDSVEVRPGSRDGAAEVAGTFTGAAGGFSTYTVIAVQESSPASETGDEMSPQLQAWMEIYLYLSTTAYVPENVGESIRATDFMADAIAVCSTMFTADPELQELRAAEWRRARAFPDSEYNDIRTTASYALIQSPHVCFDDPAVRDRAFGDAGYVTTHPELVPAATPTRAPAPTVPSPTSASGPPTPAPTATAPPAPTAAPTGTGGRFESVSAGTGHSCGVREDGSVACWGLRFKGGQLRPPEGVFQSVSAGVDHTCGVREDGSVACWGEDGSGQASPPQGAFTAISAGTAYTCGVREGGPLECWGWNEHGQASPPQGVFISVSAGGQHACGLREDNSIACWGWNEHGQSSPPQGVFTAVSAGGWSHSCGLRENGSVSCWGSDSKGQSSPPQGSFTAIRAGGNACGLREDGSLACWGDDGSGQSSPPQGSFTWVSAGTAHACAVRGDGSLACWGSDSNGQATPP